MSQNNTISIFRWIARAEGVSYLLLFLVTMPIKYLGISDLPNLIMGMLHGGLFIAYIMLLLPVKQHLKWSFKQLLYAGVASLLPFGTFVMEKKYLNN